MDFLKSEFDDSSLRELLKYQGKRDEDSTDLPYELDVLQENKPEWLIVSKPVGKYPNALASKNMKSYSITPELVDILFGMLDERYEATRLQDEEARKFITNIPPGFLIGPFPTGDFEKRHGLISKDRDGEAWRIHLLYWLYDSEDDESIGAYGSVEDIPNSILKAVSEYLREHPPTYKNSVEYHSQREIAHLESKIEGLKEDLDRLNKELKCLKP